MKLVFSLSMVYKGIVYPRGTNEVDSSVASILISRHTKLTGHPPKEAGSIKLQKEEKAPEEKAPEAPAPTRRPRKKADEAKTEEVKADDADKKEDAPAEAQGEVTEDQAEAELEKDEEVASDPDDQLP